MGADNLRSFHRWQNWRGIASLVPIVVVDRLGPSLYAAACPPGKRSPSSEFQKMWPSPCPTAPGPGLDVPARAQIAFVLDGATRRAAWNPQAINKIQDLKDKKQFESCEVPPVQGWQAKGEVVIFCIGSGENRAACDKPKG